MLGEKIKIFRKINSLNQVEFAKIIGVSKRRLSDLENDKAEISLDTVIQIADCFKVSIDYLLGRTKYRTIYTNGLSGREISHLHEIVLDLLANKNQNCISMATWQKETRI